MREDRMTVWIIVTVSLIIFLSVDPARARFVDIIQSLDTPGLRDHCSAAGGNMNYDGTGGASCSTNCHGGPGNACVVTCKGGKCSGQVPGRRTSGPRTMTVRGILGTRPIRY
jgi:hypothetical protein